MDHHPSLFFYRHSVGLTEVEIHEPSSQDRIPEAFVHDLWASQRFDRAGLVTVQGEPLQILHPGRLNPHAGPDFLDATIQLGNTRWHGAIEIHLFSQQWQGHRHHEDPRYDATVLHVSLHEDIWTGQLRRRDGSLLPEWIMLPHLLKPIRSLLYAFRIQQTDKLPCEAHLPEVELPAVAPWIEALGKARLRRRKDALAEEYLRSSSLDELLYRALFEALGYVPNASAMRALAERVPLNVLREAGEDIEAILFGLAGLMPDEPAANQPQEDDYVAQLRRRWNTIRAELETPSLPATSWRFFRLRPANFPTHRLAQAAALCSGSGLLARDPIERLVDGLHQGRPAKAWLKALEAEASPYWRRHYRFGKSTRPHRPMIGLQRRQALVVNAIAPILLLHAEQTGHLEWEGRILDAIRQLPAERDQLVNRYDALNFPNSHALAGQGLHFLSREFCAQKQCLHCQIGKQILNLTA